MIRPVRPDGRIETGGVFVPIARPRVTDRIAAAAMQRVVLIAAPAGYGKSVALHQYLDTLSEPYVRYDVLPDNAGLLGFLRGFADALSEIAPDARSTVAGAYEKNAASPSPGADLALWMHAHLKGYRGFIAIDDLHVAQEDREVTRFLGSLIERTRGGVQWVLATRATTGLPIATWLAYGESDLAIDEHELRFSVDEAREAARAFRLGVRDEELHELLELTDGWATAMTFALRSSTRSVDLRSISSMTREMIYRYLAEQVYQTLGDEEREFLTTAALLPDLDLDVMIAAGFDRTKAMIEELRARVAFVSETEPGRYRLHDLFREYLLHELDLRGSEARRERLARLGQILEDRGKVAEALRLYVNAQSPGDATRLLEAHGLPLLDSGFADDLEGVCSARLGDVYERSAIVVGIRGALDLARGRQDDGERKIARAIATLPPGELRAQLTLRLAARLDNQNEDAAELLAPVTDDPAIPVAVRAEAEALLAASLARSGDVVSARGLVAQAEARRAALTSDDQLARVTIRIGRALEVLGDLAGARRCYAETADLGSRGGLWSLAARSLRNLSVLALFVDSDSAGSLTYAQDAAAAATRAGDYADLQTALLAILSLETRRGHERGAVQAEKQLADLSPLATQATIASLASSRAHRHVWAGEYAEAQRLFGSILDRQIHASDRMLVRASYALALALAGAFKQSGSVVATTLQLMDGLHEPAQHFGALIFEFAYSMLVLSETLAGRHTAVARLLKRPLIGTNPVALAMRIAVETLARTAKNPSYVDGELDAAIERITALGFGGYARYVEKVAAAFERRNAPTESVVLTPQELSVLRGLAAGLTPKQIAAESGRSVYTVQTHIQNVIEKFGCHGRAEAIAAARRSGQLSPP